MANDAYEKYLSTPAWRSRRNARLKLAGYQCERCGAKRHVEVHHRTYDRLGAEWNEDLEVLCRNCHEAHHIDAMHDAPSGRVFLKLASEIIRQNTAATFADLSALLKEACIELKIPYDIAAADRALSLLSGSARVTPPEPPHKPMYAVIDAIPSIGHQQAREVLKRLGFLSAMKTMPATPPSDIEIDGPIESDYWGDHDRY